VTITGLIGLAFVILFFVLIIISATADRSRPGMVLREIPAFAKLRRVIGLAVEAGSRLHITLGRGSIIGRESTSAFVGLSVLERLARSASTGDNPLIATAGESSLAILAQDTLSSSYQQLGLSEQYDSTSGQMVGFTPFSYAGGTLAMAADKNTGATILIGNFGVEVALITDASERSRNLTLAGTDNIPAQAVLYATAQEPLIGEEIYAGGAYVNAGPMHVASLRAQDTIRWILVAVILIGLLLKLSGLDSAVSNLLGGLP
jgi:hypothetical protein